MRTLAAILALITAFSGWQMLRRYQNERHLAVAVSAVAGRDVGVRCPGFFKRLVEITPDAGSVGHGEGGARSTETKAGEPRTLLGAAAAQRHSSRTYNASTRGTSAVDLPATPTPTGHREPADRPC